MTDIRTTTTNYRHPTDPNLLNIHKAMQFNSTGEPVVRVHVDGITLEGDVIVDTVSLSSSTLAALETVTIANTSFAITNFPTTSTVYQGTTPWITTITNWPEIQYVNGVLYAVQSGTWSVGVTGNVTVDNFTSTVNIASLPSVSGTVVVSSLPAVTGTVIASNFTSTVNVNSMPAVTGTVTVNGSVTVTNFTDVITVVVNEDAGEIFGLNNHATNVHRGWMMDDVMRPVISIRLNPATTTSATLMKIVEYEIGNNNANQSTIMYEWYEGDLTIAGAAIPAWSTVHDTAATQYRVYQDQYSSNQGNTFTIPSGTVMRHSGIIIGKNTEGDGIPKPLTGGATGKTWTLCMKRLDNGTELDVWFAFTFKELT